ncbi:MAG: CPBP family intramembrane glutamic endopeptidase [Promethearchaeota archaeon]
MNDKEPYKFEEDHEPGELKWMFCPICGKDLPNVKNLKFCIKCGTNIAYIKEYQKLPVNQTYNPYKTQMGYSHIQPPPIYYEVPKIADEELIDNKDQILWGTSTSIGLPLVAFFLMNIILAIFIGIISYPIIDEDRLYNLITNSYFISIIALFELVLMIIPVMYVRKYLQNPTIKNGLILLGFTSRDFDRRRILKEILIGISFSIIGVLLVTSIAVFLELILELVFRIEIIQETSDLSVGIIPKDIPSLFIFSVVIIVVIGTSEEILFRGFMQKGLERSSGNSKWAIIITAFLFSMIHLIGLIAYEFESPLSFVLYFLLTFFPYFAISLLLGLLYYWRENNLIAVVICHGVYDVITIVLAYILYVVF